MIRILKFFGAFLLVLAGLLGTIYVFNKQAVDSVFRNDLSEGTEWVPKTYSLAGLVGYIVQNPSDISLVSLRGDHPDSSIRFGANTSRALGNLAHLMLLASYVDAVADGLIAVDEPVDMALLQALQAPGHEVNGHAANLAELKGEKTPTLDRLAALLAFHNDASFADYLYRRLGRERIFGIPERFDLRHTQPPLPWSGVIVAWDPRAQGKPFEALEADYLSMTDSAYHAHVTAIGERFLHEGGFRSETAQKMGSGEPLLFVQEKRRHAMTTRGEPEEYARLMHGLLVGDLLSPPASAHLYRLLSWPLDNRKVARDFSRYAAVYDSKMGYLAGVDFGVRTGETQPTAQVFIMENIPIGLFLHLSSNLMTQDFQQRLIWDPALAKIGFEELRGTQTDSASLNP